MTQETSTRLLAHFSVLLDTIVVVVVRNPNPKV